MLPRVKLILVSPIERSEDIRWLTKSMRTPLRPDRWAAGRGPINRLTGACDQDITIDVNLIKYRSESVRLRDTSDATAGALRSRYAEVAAAVRSAKLGEVADEFDLIHTIQRARAVGSVDHMIAAADLRPYVVDALDRGLARSAGGTGPSGAGRSALSSVNASPDS